MPGTQRRIGHQLAALAAVAIGLATLWPAPQQARRALLTPVYCVVCGDLGGLDFMLNVLMFAPLGLGLCLAGFSRRRAVILSLLLSLTVELLQFELIPGRDASLGDLMANVLGGATGATIGLHWRALAAPDARLARWFALTFGLALAWVWAGTAWALGPAFPQGTAWFGGWAPEFDNFGTFRGRVLSVAAGGQPLLPGPALDQGRLQDAVNARPALEFSAASGPSPGSLAPIAVIVDSRQQSVLLIGQRGQDLIFGYRMRAAILRLRMPLFGLAGGSRWTAGDTVTGAASLEGGRVTLATASREHRDARSLPLSASWGWALFWPWEPVVGTDAAAATLVWIGILLALLGYWSWLAGGAARAIPVAVILLQFAVIPMAAGFPTPGWWDWCTAVLGAGLGALVGWALPPGPLGPEPGPVPPNQLR